MQFVKATILILGLVQADRRGSSLTTKRRDAIFSQSTSQSPGNLRLTQTHGKQKQDIRLKKTTAVTKDMPPKKRNLRQSVRRETLQKAPRCAGIRKIVQCKDSVPEEVCKAQLVQAGVQILSDMPKTVYFAICIDTEAEVALVARLTDVEGVEDDPPRTLSVIKGSFVKRDLQWSEQVTPYGVNLVKAPEFWSRYNGNQGAGVKVCIIDTGLQVTHEDIRDASASGSDGLDLVTPWNQDGNSHGTHVAGTIAAQDNDRGVIGVAPQASLHIVRVFDSAGEFTASSLIVAMNACANAGSKIISMSLGGPIDTLAERSTIRTLHEQGLFLVAASGNDAMGSNLIEFPAAYDHVLSVGAVDQSSKIAEFSTHNTQVDVAAPGVDVLSLGIGSDSDYLTASGTSMAAPHVAGVAALLFSQFPTKTPTEMEQALTASAQNLGSCGKDPMSGYGLVDAVAAATYLESGATPAQPSNCVSVGVTLTTDDYGSETLYFVTPDQDRSNIVYRGGPYVDSQRATYQDTFSLPDGCYSLKWVDKYGDGSSDPTTGVGAVATDYGGTRQIDESGLSGTEESFQFGNCGGGTTPVASPVESTAAAQTQPPTVAAFSTPSPTVFLATQPPTVAPVVAPVTPSPTVTPLSQAPTFIFTDDGTEAPTVTAPTVASPVAAPTLVPQSTPTVLAGCGPNEAFLQISITTDSWSRSENQLYLFEESAPDDVFIWKMPRFQLQGNSDYAGETCIDLLQECSKFYFFDEFGDGFEAGGLTLSLNGAVVLQILPGDKGAIFEEGSQATFWYQEFGNCQTTSGAD